MLIGDLKIGQHLISTKAYYKSTSSQYNILVAEPDTEFVVRKIDNKYAYFMFKNGYKFKRLLTIELDDCNFNIYTSPVLEYNFVLLEDVYASYRVVFSGETFKKKDFPFKIYMLKHTMLKLEKGYYISDDGNKFPDGKFKVQKFTESK